MKIAEGYDIKLYIADIESYEEIACFCFKDIDTQEWYDFVISKYQNDLYKFIKWYTNLKVDYEVFFNGVNYDEIIITWILKNYNKWFNKDGREIARLIKEYSDLVIDNSRHKVRQEFQESNFKHKILDPFKVWHYDREQRSTGLKKLEFSMNFPNIEELPFNPDVVGLTEKQCDKIVEYCHNDVNATELFIYYTIGQTDHKIYKGDNKIELRLNLKDEFNLDSINISNTKIGDSIIRKEYCKFANVKEKDLPTKGFFRSKIPVKQCIPPYVKFNTPVLKKFLEDIRGSVLQAGEEFKKTVKFAGKKYSFAKGGIHSENKGQYFEVDDEYIYVDWDVTSYYPWIMINNLYAPFHLNKLAFVEAFRSIADRRKKLKPLAKTDKKIKGVVEGLKIAANSIYGFTSDKFSWIYDPLVTMQTTITGELSLLMLIEMHQEAGIETISANTDGITLKVRRDMIEKMMEVNARWMEITGYSLEDTYYDFIAYKSVNDYIALKTFKEKEAETIDDRLKVKGDFLIDTELHGDKSRRAVRLALFEYFVNDIPVEESIRNNKNIYDFCIGVKSSNDYHYELVEIGKTISPLRSITNIDEMEKTLIERGYWREGSKWLNQEIIDVAEELSREADVEINYHPISLDSAWNREIISTETTYGNRDVLKKMVRYYISNNGKVILKIKNPESEKKGNPESHVESSSRVDNRYQPVVTYFNEFIEKDDYDINYDYYIYQAQKTIDFIELRKDKKGKVIKTNPDQLNLF